MKFIAIFLVMTLIIKLSVTVITGDPLTAFHNKVMGEYAPFGDMQIAADVWNVTPENIDTLEFLK